MIIAEYLAFKNIILFRANQTDCDTIQAMKDDIVIISSDGLFDNLDHSEIEEICLKVWYFKSYIFTRKKTKC